MSSKNDRQATVYIGTMGFSYKDWKSVFYPDDLNPRQYLAYYSRIFNSVEIDSTFYGVPKKDTLAHWAASTPPGFKFSLKTPRSITHELGLTGAWGLMDEYLDAIRHLGERLGVILLQFPPSFKAENLDRLVTFIAKLPAELDFAIEFRDQSWYTAEQAVEAELERYQVTWAATQYPNLPGRIHKTSRLIYIRWIGRHGTFRSHSQERIDRTGDLEQWKDQIEAGSVNASAIFGYFNNDFAGFAAGTAMKFYEMMDIPLEKPPHLKQARLF
jgi:uncharacterized protein YecE (DUF72 family)